jgi:hypothetical protein
MNPKDIQEEIDALRRRRKMLLELNPDADVYAIDEKIDSLQDKKARLNMKHGDLITRDVRIDPS